MVSKSDQAFPVGTRMYIGWSTLAGRRERAVQVVACVPPGEVPDACWYESRPLPGDAPQAPPFTDSPQAKPCMQYVLQVAVGPVSYIVFPHWRWTWSNGEPCEEGQSQYYVPRRDVMALRMIGFTYREPSAFDRQRAKRAGLADR